MSKILIKNCNLISMSDKREKLEKGVDILLNGSKIEKIGKNLSSEENDIDKIINANGKVAMPGLIDTHAHISMSIFRETVDGYKTQDWLVKEIWPREANFKDEDIYWATMLSCLEMIKTGTTTANDMYFFTDDIIKAALDSGIRLQTTRCLMGYKEEELFKIDELRELVKKYHDDKISFNVGIHGFYTSNEQYVKKCVEYAKESGLPIHTHFCENQQERDDIIREYNVKNPAEVVKRDFDGIHNILAHSVKLTNEDIEILKGTNSYISHCPVSNLKLGCGVAPIREMIDAGLCVSLGTDGQGSGSNLDMFETMKFTALLQKGINEDPELMNAYDVIKMATVNGAKALELNDIGTIEEGKTADLILIDMNDVLTQPINNIFAEIVYNVKGYNVDTTIINGNVLMENRKTKLNEEEIYAKCKPIFDKLSEKK